MSKYLLENCGFNYVLLGKIQSDMIERRFSRIHQLSGANYYISMRQLQESDKKIRSISLLKYSQISIAKIDIIVKTKCISNNKLMATTKALQAELLFNILPTAMMQLLYFMLPDTAANHWLNQQDALNAKRLLQQL